MGAQRGLTALHSLRNPEGLPLNLGGCGQGQLGTQMGPFHPSSWQTWPKALNPLGSSVT